MRDAHSKHTNHHREPGARARQNGCVCEGSGLMAQRTVGRSQRAEAVRPAGWCADSWRQQEDEEV
jgi:hypothetical protein